MIAHRDYVWLEVDRATERPVVLRRTINRYTRAYQAGIALSDPAVFPRIIWVVPDETRAAQVHALCEASAAPQLFAVCLTDDLAATITVGPEANQ